MHACRHRCTIVVLLAVTLVLGCRGTHPLKNMVQISKSQDVDLPDVDVPKQRLAVNKPRSRSGAGAEVADRSSVSADENPHVNRLAADPAKTARTPSDTVGTNLASSRKPATGPSATGPSATGVANKTAAAKTAATKSALAKSSAAKLAASKTAPPKTTAAKTASAASAALTAEPAPGPTVASSSESITDMTEEEMSAAFESQPEEVKRMAMRQLIASINASAKRTSQPAAVDAAIAKSVHHLPELPKASGVKPKIPATRIASKQASESTPSAGNKSGVESKLVDGAATPATGATKLGSENAGLETVIVQSISDQSAPSDVQPASAVHHSDGQSMVSQAGSDPLVSAASSTAASGLSEQALYLELLQRLSVAPESENDASRSSRLIKLRHLMVLSGDPDAAVEKVEGMSEYEQEYLRHQLLGLWTMVDPQGHPVPSRRFATALPQMRQATRFAAAATDALEVRSIAFCTEIESYGQIKTFPGNRFQAGKQVILYCEIDNFTVATTNEGYETHLQGRYDIFNSDNEKIIGQDLPADKQLSANYLRDYFIAYQMHLPQQLSPGTYRLQLTMEDVGGKKYGQSSIPFEIAK